MVLLGYLPVPKLKCFSEAKKPLAAYQLFHDCMRSLLHPLAEAGREGVKMVCADGFIRTMHPILAAYIADHPEQCLVACVKENHCPKCTVSPLRRGQGLGRYEQFRNPTKTANVLNNAAAGHKSARFDELGLRPIISPFWIDLPHSDIFTCITPDILHQLHKGMFKDHIVKWTTACIVGKDKELDRRFIAMPHHPDIRYFQDGVSLVSQWTGTEYKNMEKVFLGAIAGAAPKEVTRAVRGLLDFIYYARFEAHTTESLSCLNSSWHQFHTNKRAFLQFYLEKEKMPASWANFNNIPKLHAMDHYLDSIQLLGTADGYNTEGPERLHIDFAKRGYRAGNRKEYIKHMTRWLNRQEAIHRFNAYLRWLQGQSSESPTTNADIHAGGSTQSMPDTEITNMANVEDEEVERSARVDGANIKYWVAKKPPYVNMKARDVSETFGAADFSWYLEDFLRKKASQADATLTQTMPPIILSPDTRVSVYKQCKLELPHITQASKKAEIDVIKCVPPSATEHNGVRLKSSPGLFSTILAKRPTHSSRTDPANTSEHSTSRARREPLRGISIITAHICQVTHAERLLDISVGRVRAIFRVPIEWCALAPHPLAYVEWFTPLNTFNEDLAMFSVKPSTHNHYRAVSLIPVTEIMRSCHLIPQWGKSIDRTWTQENIYEKCDVFYVNPYLRLSDFVLFRFISGK